MNRWVDLTSSVAATLLRVGMGVNIAKLGRRPEQALELYEFEACPYCRKVREALCVLDLDVRIRPCPKAGPNYREELKQRAGKYLYPYLVDPNTGKEMYESDDIVAYLFQEYGDGRVPALLRPGVVTLATATLASAVRVGAGSRYRPALRPELELELYSFEASPFCRLVRETLCCLELPYLLHNVAKGSPRRTDFVRRSGKMMVPYLVDPNTGTELFESADIVRHLEKAYADAN